jgi:hypothetical protein
MPQLLRRKLHLGIVVVLVALAFPTALIAQSATGSIVGSVLDDAGAALPGATLTVVNPETGFTRITVASENGSYRFASLPAGTYNLKIELAGFATLTQEGVVLNVSTTRTINVNLRQAQVTENITVTAQTPLVETTPSIGTVVSQNELQSLPLNGRQFANLAVLAPGTALAYNTDPTKPGQLAVALNGGIGRNVNYIMDGGDNTDDTIGGALQNFNLEAVQEFNIQTMQYKAEYGRSSGGVLTVVTKTGTNQLKGSVYGFFRSDSWNSKTEKEKRTGADKQAYDRKQYGFAIGGPIVKDKAHFFATYERIDRTTNYVVDSEGIYTDLDGKTYELPFKDELITAKGTYDINAKQFLQVRFGYQKNSDKYGATPLAAPTNLGTVTNKYSSILLGHTAQVGEDMLNEFVFQYTKFNNTISADSQDPLLYYPNGFSIGQSINTPQATHQTKYQYKDDFSFSRVFGGKRHDFKAGVGFINEPVLGGDFTSGTTGQYSLVRGPAGGPQWVVVEITKYGGFSGDKTPTKQYSAYFQDDWYVTKNVTVNVGLRYDYYDALRLDQRSNPIWQKLSTQTKYNEGYLKDFQGGKGGITRNSKNGWAPRLGFSWDINNDGRQIVRGGIGRYYDFPYSNATTLFPSMAVQSNYGVVYSYKDQNGIRNEDGTFYQPGQTLPKNQLANPDITAPNEVASPTWRPPHSDQASLGYSWQPTRWLGINIEAVKVRYRNLPFRFRANPTDPETGKSRFPEFGNFRIWYGKGQADYQGFNIGFRARHEKLELQGFYTYSKSEGNILTGADEFRLTDRDYQPDLSAVRDQTVNPYDPLCDACIGPLNTDSRHKFTFGVVYQLPLEINISGMFRYRSATPYTDWAGKDLNGDGMAFDLKPGVTEVNSLRGHSFSQFDLRLSREFKLKGEIGIELIAEVFNLFNTKNPAAYRGNCGWNAEKKTCDNTDSYRQPSSYAGDYLQGEQRLAQFGLRFHF